MKLGLNRAERRTKRNLKADVKNRRLGTTLVAIAAALTVFLMTARTVSPQATSCRVDTISGTVQGSDLGASCAFLGIPFAAPPVGVLRWKPPQPATPWAPAVLMATSQPPNCPNLNPAGSTNVQGSENCLRLNVWTPNPAPTVPAPVIVWIHTGAFQGASANLPAHNGRNLAERTGAIVVSGNYRLGPLGFMGHPALTAEDPGYPSSGNYGLLDQRAVMVWVRDHIAAFGGDPHNVTIAGQSAGGNSVSMHVVSPGSAGYFQRAIMHSGYASTRWRTLADAEELGTGFAAAIGCSDPASVLTCMRNASVNQVLLAFPNGQQQLTASPRVAWGPVIDGLDITDQPRTLYENGTFNRVPIIIGATRDEGWIYVDRSFRTAVTEDEYEAAVLAEFGDIHAPAILARYPVEEYPSPKHALSQLVGDVEAVCEVRRVARLIERTRTPVFVYSFEHEIDAVSPDLVIHGLDTNIVFGNNYAPPTPYVLNAEDRALSEAIGGYWTQFAATGNPNTDDPTVVHWPAFKRPTGNGRGVDKYLVLASPIRKGLRLREDHCDFWEPYFFRSISDSRPAGMP